MKKNSVIFFLFILSGLLFSCGNTKQKTTGPGSVVKSVHADSLTIRYANCFNISYYNNYKLITIYTDRHSGKDSLTYLLYNRNEARPEVPFKTTFIATPVSGIISLSSFYTGCIAELNGVQQLMAVDNGDFIHHPTVSKKIQEGIIREVNRNNELNPEALLLLKPELVITYGGSNSTAASLKKLETMGVPVCYCIENLENSALGRAEWIKLIAAFLNQEKKAVEIFNEIEKNYLRLKNMISTTTQKPSVFTELKYGDVWYEPGGNSYISHLLQDAGAHYIWEENEQSGSLALNFEEVYSKAHGADYWLHLHQCQFKKDLLAADSRYAHFQAYKTGNLYNNNKSSNAKGGNAFWERGLLHCDEVLADLIHIFHPQYSPQHQLIYYKKLE